MYLTFRSRTLVLLGVLSIPPRNPSIGLLPACLCASGVFHLCFCVSTCDFATWTRATGPPVSPRGWLEMAVGAVIFITLCLQPCFVAALHSVCISAGMFSLGPFQLHHRLIQRAAATTARVYQRGAAQFTTGEGAATTTRSRRDGERRGAKGGDGGVGGAGKAGVCANSTAKGVRRV